MQDYLDRTIRNLVMTNLVDIKRLFLTPAAVSAIKFIASKSDGVISNDIAEKYNISVQNASQHLTNLHNKGYLVRREIKSDSGGIQYVYWASPDLSFEPEGK